ncbi:MAG: SusC/RagA family TonB-linked outer membrane protein [Bacteroidetes bacterium]|jgi:TonB-linked SusC/RagA family outer membrane protein|nr:SusC/RagA family TonB-linked outer membrane protein [Bacteroidota bacterium]
MTLLVLGLCLSSAEPAYAQQPDVITGTVTDAQTGESLPGVNVRILGTNIGAATNTDGTYRLSQVPASADSLAFSFIGYVTERVSIDGRSEIDIQLVKQVLEAGDLVVTALGLEQVQRALGYSVEEIDGAAISQVERVNVANALAGRVAGLQVTQSGSGPGGSARIVVRGSSSLNKDNQALIVLDGVPVDNTNLQSAGRFGGFDYGDGITNLNPSDIESVSVLKGPNAAALYGTRAANGAIVVTTKKGEAQEGLGVTYNSTLTFESPTVWFDEEFQNTFGRGTQGQVCVDQDPPVGNQCLTNDGTLIASPGIESSFGPRMEGQPVQRFNGEVAPFSPQEDNIRDFYDMGSTVSNNLALTGGNETATFRASYTNLQNNGILPGHDLDQNTFQLAGTVNLTDRLSATGRATYLKRTTFNRPNLTDNPDNTVYSFLFTPRSVRLDALQPFQTPSGQPVVWNNQVPGRRQNPYWTVNLNTNNDERDRLLGLLQAEYAIAPWLALQVRGGLDQYAELRRFRRANNTVFEISTAPSRALFRETSVRVEEINYDALLTASGQLTSDFSGEVSVGSNRLLREATLEGFTGNGTSVPNLFVRTNAVDEVPFVDVVDRREIQSIYALGRLGYRTYAYLDVSARNDWSSTLPVDNRSFFYPSFSGSFIFTDAFDLDGPYLSFGKLRASWAQTGNDADPFQIQQTFGIGGPLGGSFGGQNYASTSDVRPNPNTEPEITTSVEIGTDLRFLRNRLDLEVTYYTQTTDNQVLAIPVSSSSGFTSQIINAGEITNRGFEVRVGGSPIRQENLQWNLNFNFAANRSEVRNFPGDITTRVLGTSRSGVQVVAEEGEEFGNIVGERYLRNDTGEIVVGPDGIPERDPERGVIGNFQPDWTGGVNTTFQWRSISLDAVIDIRQGGEIYSLSNVITHQNGNHRATLEGRDRGFIFDGVTADGAPNQVAVDPEVFWAEVAAFPDGAIDEEFIYDASNIRLSEVTLRYRFPTSLLQATPIRRASISFIGRNLFFLERHTDGFDPIAYSRSNSSFVQGLEYAAFPNSRSLGVNLNVQF